jgi:hypothetical protein
MVLNDYPISIEQDLYELTEGWNWFLSFYPFRLVFNVLFSIFRKCFFLPLWWLYLNGPYVNGYLFWGGRSKSDICYHISTVEAKFWESSPENMIKCEYLVHREFSAFLVGILGIAYLGILVLFFMWLYRRICHTNRDAYAGTLETLRELCRERYRSTEFRASPEYKMYQRRRRTESIERNPRRRRALPDSNMYITARSPVTV